MLIVAHFAAGAFGVVGEHQVEGGELAFRGDEQAVLVFEEARSLLWGW